MESILKALVEKELINATPEQGIIAEYMSYAYPLTDAPYQYHLIGALIDISTVISNRIYIPFGDLKIYPNIYAILVGTSSIPRKSTTLGIARRFISKVNEDALFPHEITPEALKEALSAESGGKAQGIFYFSEFGSFLAQCELQYMRGMKEFFTDIYDCPEKYIRKLKGSKFTILNPCINIFGASDVNWLIDKFREKDIRGGFLPRFIFFIADKKDDRFISIPPKPDIKMQSEIVSKLGNLTSIQGEVDLSQITELYDSWAREHNKELTVQANQDLLASFYSRLAIYCLKFAVLYQMSDKPSLIITPESFDKAKALVNYLKYTLGELLATELVFGKDMQNRAKILKQIQQHPGIKHSTLLSNTHIIAKDFHTIITTLIEEEKINVTNKQYYPKDNPK